MAMACSQSALEGRLNGVLERTDRRSRGVSRPLPDMQRLAANDDAAGLRSARPTSHYWRAAGQLESDSSDENADGVLSAGHSEGGFCSAERSRTKRLGSEPLVDLAGAGRQRRTVRVLLLLRRRRRRQRGVVFRCNWLFTLADSF